MHAGRELAKSLAQYREQSPIVLGLPRGGVPVAYEVARALGAPLDVSVVRKLGAPVQPELGMGAVAEGGEVFVDPNIVRAVGASEAEVKQVVDRKTAEVEERCRRFRHGGPAPEVVGKTVLLVDDGVATGGTARAAIRALQRRGAGWVVLAVPVGAAETLEALSSVADEVVCKSPRNRFVARALREAGLATLRFDLLTQEEEELDAIDGYLRFDIGLLAERLVAATDWVRQQRETRDLRIGYFGASTGAAAALIAATERADVIGAIVSRGGRPDLADAWLTRVRAPTLLIVGGEDEQVLQLNRAALQRLKSPKSIKVIPNASHLFEEPGALEQVAQAAAEWFGRHLTQSRLEEARP